MALNARGFARFKLRDWAHAIEDLDQAILIDPKYANAYRIRAVARTAIGDAAGAAADFEKSRQLAQAH
jgi:Tfp pilus assembly protein PilF